MPRRNLWALILIGLISLLCYQKVQTNVHGRLLVDAMEQIENRYVEPVPPRELFEGAMEGMVDRLDDPYSAYISPRMVQEFNETIDQEFEGVGMEVSLDPKTRQLTVTSPLYDSPAYRAGIRPGDKILRIEDQSTQGMSLSDAVHRMRGPPGTSVSLTIQHIGAEEPVEIEITRANIPVQTVVGDRRNPDGSWHYFLEDHPTIGYLRINAFSGNTSVEVRETLDALLAEGMEALVLDLRNDPGGLLGAAVDICDMFIESGAIVTIRRRNRSDTMVAQPEGTYGDFPMAVLVNGRSASASEIVAACLQDHHRALIVGQRTWGKGSVQEVIQLEDGHGALKLTTASYWRPSGENIHRKRDDDEDDQWGVRPDDGYEVIVENDEAVELRTWRLRRDIPREETPEALESEMSGNSREPFVDRQLAKAVEYVRQRLGKGQDQAK